MNVLWLASWYPSELSPYDGDFVQRHARAASKFCTIHVLHVIKDGNGTITKSTKEVTRKSDGLTETILYYYSPLGGLIGKLVSELKYRRHYKKLVKRYIEQTGKPHLVHVHVSLKAGVIAGWIKKSFDLPYLLTEHWSGLLEKASPTLGQFPAHFKIRYKKVVNGALGISVVSNHLASQMQKRFAIQAPLVIPNVVDVSVFKPVVKGLSSAINFIHISGLAYEKNFETITAACKLLKDEGAQFKLDVFGGIGKNLSKRVAALQLDEEIFFHPEVPQPQLAKALQQADALILYSHYETFGCVVIEANACGVPVIASDIPAMRELITEGENGLLAPSNNASALTKTVREFINSRHTFDRRAIAQNAADKFSYDVVGQTIVDWYESQNVR